MCGPVPPCRPCAVRGGGFSALILMKHRTRSETSVPVLPHADPRNDPLTRWHKSPAIRLVESLKHEPIDRGI